MKNYLIVFSIVLFLLICGCNGETINSVDKETDKELIMITDAKEKIENGAILLDVRTPLEYSEKHVEGAVSLPVDDINEASVEELVDSKDTVIIVYCMSGNRSGRAVSILEDLGYTNVYDLGSIDNWEG